MGSTVSQKVSNLPGKSQHWKYLQELEPDVRTEIVKKIIQNVFTDNDDNTYSSTINNLDDLKNSIARAIRAVAAEDPRFKPTSKTIINFLVDRLANKELLGNVKYTTDDGENIILDKDVTQKDVKNALNKALSSEPLEGENDDADGDEDIQDNEVEHEDDSTESKLVFNPREEYWLNDFDSIPSGTLSGDIEVVYRRISGLSGDAHKGEVFVNMLKRSDTKPYFLQKLLDLGVLEPSESEIRNVGDTEGFDEPEEDFVRRYTSSGLNDLRGSSPASRFGGEDVFG
jgi:hypothetical protein